MAQNLDNLPEILFSDAKDTAASRRIRRLAERGRLRKLYAGIYTSNLDSPPESIVVRNWLAIVGQLLPGGGRIEQASTPSRSLLSTIATGSSTSRPPGFRMVRGS